MAAVVVMPYEKMFLIDEAEYMKINRIQYPDPNTASMTTDDNDNDDDDDDDDNMRPDTTIIDSHGSVNMSSEDESHASVRSRRSPPRNVVAAQEIVPRG